MQVIGSMSDNGSYANLAVRTEIHTSVTIYPVDARRGSRTEQAARTDVIPAAVPSIVFSTNRKSSTALSKLMGKLCPV